MIRLTQKAPIRTSVLIGVFFGLLLRTEMLRDFFPSPLKKCDLSKVDL